MNYVAGKDKRLLKIYLADMACLNTLKKITFEGQYSLDTKSHLAWLEQYIRSLPFPVLGGEKRSYPPCLDRDGVRDCPSTLWPSLNLFSHYAWSEGIRGIEFLAYLVPIV
jgi:hypothetical protein